MILAFDLLLISPSKTLEPAIFPMSEILKIFWISAEPIIFSLYSGSNNPDKALLIKSKTS